MTQDSAGPTATSNNQGSPISRRKFLAASVISTAALATGCKTAQHEAKEPIIDIHQHLGYSGRTDDVFLEHQRKMGITKTILLPAGRSVITASTHEGFSNGLQAKALGNGECYHFAREHRNEY